MLEINIENKVKTTEFTEYDNDIKKDTNVKDNTTDIENSNIIENPIKSNNLKEGDIFRGQITTSIKTEKGTKRCKFSSVFKVDKIDENKIKVTRIASNDSYNTTLTGIKVKSGKDIKEKIEEDKEKDKLSKILEKQKAEEEKQKAEEEKRRKEFEDKAIDFDKLEPEDKLKKTIEAGITNIWMVGPAGCGKSTMARNVANTLSLPYLCISCGIGTSATEFVGYKYPTREGTKFADYYSKPSIILLDEFTALDPSVAQVCNAALANGEIETTTGLVKRHKDCIIIATSNTFGTGADRQYVANNQLDSSTIDRFIGGIIEVDYSSTFEAQYDKEVVEYIQTLRICIKDNAMRRIASTRMIQAGDKLKHCFFKNWKEQLIINWSETEKAIINKKLEEINIKNAIPMLYKPKLIQNKLDGALYEIFSKAA